MENGKYRLFIPKNTKKRLINPKELTLKRSECWIKLLTLGTSTISLRTTLTGRNWLCYVSQGSTTFYTPNVRREIRLSTLIVPVIVIPLNSKWTLWINYWYRSHLALWNFDRIWISNLPSPIHQNLIKILNKLRHPCYYRQCWLPIIRLHLTLCPGFPSNLLFLRIVPD